MFFILHADVCGKSIPHGHSHGHNHSHSHDHDHDHEHNDDNLESVDATLNNSTLVGEIVTGHNRDHSVRAKKSAKNINVRAAMIHVIGDFVQSVGVLMAAILIKFKVY